MCPAESPLSPSQVRFLSEKTFQSNIFQYCHKEFVRGIRSHCYTCQYAICFAIYLKGKRV